MFLHEQQQMVRERSDNGEEPGTQWLHKRIHAMKPAPFEAAPEAEDHDETQDTQASGSGGPPAKDP